MSDTGRGGNDIDEGWVFTLPAEDDASWDLLDARPGDDMERARVPVEPDDVTALGGTWQPVESGRFTLPAALTGEHLLCWAAPPDSGPSTALNRPGFRGGSQSPEDESHGCTEEVPGRAA